MPNWCSNQLRVSGSRDAVRRFFERAHTGNSIVSDAIEVSAVAGLLDQADQPALARAVIASSNADGVFSLSGHVPEPQENDDWYNWRVSNWGTKWDAKDPHVTVNAPRDTAAGAWECRVEFSTPWSPPWAWLERVAAMEPDLLLQLLWNEEQGLTGYLEANRGELSSQDATYEDLVEMGWCGPFDPAFFEEIAEDAATT